ncbi:hypothetical protein HMPREF9120_02339 [Neisseria sp. oral taxon 020 str. F0370]|uniref:hypothetical protein n=1 Tax=Neisseria sp. oral taxon 020 TaxID=712401 RepID=UPI0002A36B85|nr:hypothetical protein [Neisseria sp. oral taxon 020]EKY04396.1 hypothetical protein HMPREF9120_02339 [Neisseria sp. oral taxon 020 str. F0370]
MNKLTTRTLAPQTLSAQQTAALYALYGRYYGGTTPELFRRDLGEKDHILLLEDTDGQIRGFTPLKTIPFTDNGRAARAVFSGDTVIDHRYWGEQTLPLAWCALAGRLKAQMPDAPLYWLLIVKGDRTYRYLNVFSKTYYPNRRHPTPPDVQELIDRLAADRFGAHYHAESGLVRYPQSQGHLKSEWLNEKTAAHPEAAYFRRRNPRHAEGEELVCLTLLETDNLRSFALRGFLDGLAQGAL